jgi:trans-aconitate 2-methyltransferase
VTTWEPQTYLRYADIRFRAGLDLIARIPKGEYSSIYDLGCGTGHLTSTLADTFSNSKVIGIDSSLEMLAEARREFPALSWQQADIRSWRPAAQPDLIYANAALQLVPDHETLLPALLNTLRRGGVLAMQVPRHFESPSHLGLKDLVMQSAWRDKLEPLLLAPIPPPETYWRWLRPHSQNLDLWETIYLQVLDGKDPVVSFMRGTALRPFSLLFPSTKPPNLSTHSPSAWPPLTLLSPAARRFSPSAASFWSFSASHTEIFHSPSTPAAIAPTLPPVYMSHLLSLTSPPFAAPLELFVPSCCTSRN